MAEIHATAFDPQDTWSRDVFQLQLALPNVFGLLHERGGVILIRIAADEAEILTLGVTPAARRQGIALALLSEANRAAAALGATAMFLEVAVTNSAALSLYTNQGFQQVGRRSGYYSNRTDALILRLNLRPGE